MLYPDDSPRFRVIYVNGGYAATHGVSLGICQTTGSGYVADDPTARYRFQTFYNNGGSYTGTCAGASIVSRSKSGSDVCYFHLWPGYRIPTSSTCTTPMDVLPDSPLLDYYSFGSDNVINGVYHWGGYFAEVANGQIVQPGTERLANYKNFNSTRECEYDTADGKPSIWAYKANVNSGRVVITGSHPESASCANLGDNCKMMSAILQYALDGQGNPRPAKGALSDGVSVTMDASNERVGDYQYHYFTVNNLPAGTTSLNVTLTGNSADNDLFLKHGARPTRLTGDHDDLSRTTGTANETITVSNPDAGIWYAGVYGNHDVLNGASYTVTATW